MSLPQVTEVYQPAPMWEGGIKNDSLEQLAAQLQDPDEVVVNEAEVQFAAGLAEDAQEQLFAKTSFDDSISGNRSTRVYRAGQVKAYKTPNCIALAEATAALGKLYDQELSITWQHNGDPITTGHASTLWQAPATLWDIDGHYNKAEPLLILPNTPDTPETAPFAHAREALSASCGRLAVNTDLTSATYAEWIPLPDDLSQADIPYDMFHIILPAEEAIRMLAAMCDARHYQQAHPERWEALREQIEALAPPSLMPIRKVQ